MRSLKLPAFLAGKNFIWVLLALLFAASFLNYVDRQTLSILKTTLKEAFGMDDAGYAVIVNIFTACYAAAYIGSGWFVDRVGPRWALVIFCAVWSLATVGCGLVHSVLMLGLMRGLLGIAEPGLQPVCIRVMTEWAPARHRGFFMSLCGVGSSVGNVVAAPLIVWLTLNTVWGWRSAFVLPGTIGLVIAVLWLAVYREPPRVAEASEDTVAKAVAAKPAMPWSALWKTKALWGIVLCRLVSDPVWYFCLFWLPGYLQENKGLTMTQLGFVGWIPFVASSAGGILASVLSDRMAGRDRTDRLNGRKRLLIYASAGGLLCLLVPMTPSVFATVALFCLITIVCSCWLSTLAPIIAEIFPVGNVASVWGIAGAFGATGAMVFNYAIGRAAGTVGVETLFYVMAFLHPLAAAILYFLVRRPRLPERAGAGE